MTDQDVAVFVVPEEDDIKSHPLMKNVYVHACCDAFELFSQRMIKAKRLSLTMN